MKIKKMKLLPEEEVEVELLQEEEDQHLEVAEVAVAVVEEAGVEEESSC